MPVQNRMTPDHPEWNTFVDLLIGPEGCDVRDGAWKCSGPSSCSLTRALLARYFPAVDVGATLAYFEECNAYCDCEILCTVLPDTTGRSD